VPHALEDQVTSVYLVLGLSACILVNVWYHAHQGSNRLQTHALHTHATAVAYSVQDLAKTSVSLAAVISSRIASVVALTVQQHVSHAREAQVINVSHVLEHSVFIKDSA
jgi:hypothetical protein